MLLDMKKKYQNHEKMVLRMIIDANVVHLHQMLLLWSNHPAQFTILSDLPKEIPV